MALLLLAALLLSCVAANARFRSFRLQLLLVTSGLLLGPAFSGILLLLLWPTLFIALGFACWLLRFVVVRLASTAENLTVHAYFTSKAEEPLRILRHL